MAIDKLQIGKKEDNPTRIAQIAKAGLPAKQYLTAAESNAVVDKINEMIPEVNVGVSGFQGKIKISDIRTDIGFYFPEESGVYIHADNINVDISEGMNQLLFDGEKWDKIVIPFEANGKVEEGNKGAVNGDEVFKSLNPLLKTTTILKNLITNGDFNEGISGWRIRSNITEYSVNKNGLTFKGAGDLNVSDNWIMRTSLNPYLSNHVIYVTTVASSAIDSTLYVGVGYSRIGHKTSTVKNRYSFLAQNETINYPTFGAKLGDVVILHSVMCFDLTDIFGIGNEPNRIEMDQIIDAVYGEKYIDGETYVSTQNIIDYCNSRFSHNENTIDIQKRLENIEEFFDLKFENLIINGNFENNKNNWVSSGLPGTGGGTTIDAHTHFKEGKSLRIVNNNGVRREEQKVALKKGNKYYLCGRAIIENFDVGVIECVNIRINTSIIGEWQFLNAYLTPNNDSDYNIRLGSYTDYSTYTANFDEIALFNLTAIFGEGKEPSEIEMTRLFYEIYMDKSVGNTALLSQRETFNYFKDIAKPLNNVLNGIMPIVTLASDDGFATDYELYKMLQKHGLRGTTFAVSTYFGKNKYLTEEQVKEMSTAGWEFGCHTYQHINLATLDFPEDVISQVLQNKKYLENLTGKKVTTFAHPFGGSSPEIRNLLRSIYDGARVSPTGYNDFGDVANAYNLHTFWDHHTTTTIESTKARIDLLVNNPAQHLMFSMHELASDQGGLTFTLADWEEIAIYLKEYQMQGKLEVVTFSEAVRRIKSTPFYKKL